MKKLLVLFTLYFFSCSHPAEQPNTAMDTGRSFIRATLDGDFKSAEPLLLKDEKNTELFESFKRIYERLPAEKKRSYKEASYTINEYKDVNDSVSLINYSNSFMKQPLDIKLVRSDKAWKVDFKYTSEGAGAE